jgi:hypothetical protein
VPVARIETVLFDWFFSLGAFCFSLQTFFIFELQAARYRILDSVHVEYTYAGEEVTEGNAQ